MSTARRERDNSKAERAQHLKQIHDLQEHIQEKERQFMELQEQVNLHWLFSVGLGHDQFLFPALGGLEYDAGVTILGTVPSLVKAWKSPKYPDNSSCTCKELKAQNLSDASKFYGLEPAAVIPAGSERRDRGGGGGIGVAKLRPLFSSIIGEETASDNRSF
ncbi:hypothetical protein F0562_020124 [Nyssa sinensis]|uniref:Uncharacterized protein n=1 Tax=Nyssa sinensis TaxID=561372 RepID=A0A5J5BTB9_9ASTE|nr:hypothetical protein F0562_020124 [Nyssa sinensis]